MKRRALLMLSAGAAAFGLVGRRLTPEQREVVWDLEAIELEPHTAVGKVLDEA
jgi:hypothetical protein